MKWCLNSWRILWSMGEDSMSVKVVPVKNLRFSSDVHRSLSAQAEREMEGSNIDYRTPLFAKPSGSEGATPTENTRISGVTGLVPVTSESIWENLSSTGVFKKLLKDDKTGNMLKFEKGFFDYVGSSRSIKAPFAESLSKLNEYFGVPNFKPNRKAFEDAVKQTSLLVHKHIPKSSLRTVSIKEAINRLPKTTGWGAPFFLKGKEMTYDDNGKQISIVDNTPMYGKAAELIQQAILKGEEPSWELTVNQLLWRGQEGRDGKTKQSIIWGAAHGVTIMGARLFHSWIAKEMNLPWRKSLVQQEEVDKAMAVAFKNSEVMYGFDASGFDFHMHSEMMDAAAKIILDCFNLSDSDLKIFKWYFKQFKTSSIITPTGVMQGSEHNVPSGDQWTNTIDSLVNLIGANYMSLRTGVTLSDFQITGDDAVYGLTKAGEHFPTKAEAAYAELGWEVNSNKQWYDTNSVTYLKSLHLSGKEASYKSYTWTLISCMNMESPKGWKWPMYSARNMVMTSNVSPAYGGYNDFMAFMAAGDKYGLGLKSKEGSLGMLRLAGSEQELIKRLDFQSFAANQQGMDKTASGVSIDVPNLNTAKWVAAKQSVPSVKG
uniref:RdRp n=1 Tax=Beihai picobirna-like virus 4 TaxID=1922521 RepID=A0A1L3KLH3_9VIRU|nr:RdRp [Beihai picobirna-like virus 4]